MLQPPGHKETNICERARDRGLCAQAQDHRTGLDAARVHKYRA